MFAVDILDNALGTMEVNMKVGLSSWSYSWSIGVSDQFMPLCPMDAEVLMRKAIDLGAQVLQIADNCPLDRLSNQQLHSLKQQACVNGIQIEVGTRGISPQKLIPYMEIAQKLEATLVRTLIHDNDGCPTIEQAEAYLLELLHELEKRNLTLAIENHDFFKSKDLAKLIEKINHPLVGICLDPVNNLAQGESTAEVLHSLGRYTVNLHCKDYTITRKPSMLGFDVVGCATGEGILDVERCAKQLPKDINFIIELWTPWQGDLAKTIELEEQWAEKSLRYLQAFANKKVIL
jgi:sugar phosphate isomerase/epimerase